jgi:hypothetical protein
MSNFTLDTPPLQRLSIEDMQPSEDEDAPMPASGFLSVTKLMERVIKNVTRKARRRKQAIAWGKANPARKNATNKSYSQRNKRKTLKMAEDWRQANKQRVRDNENALNKKKVESGDMEFILKKRMRARLQQFMLQQGTRKNNGTFKMIGMSKSELVFHLERQLVGEETLKSSDIDHIFPLISYNPSQGSIDPRCMHYSNMQPLPSFDNGSKSDKLPTKAMAAKVDRACWPDGVTEDMLPDIYPGWATPLRML